jgi:quinol monooxygenase YgiN
MLFELRQYRLHPGQRERFVELMETEIIPFQVAKGMVILGSFTAADDPDLYVWLRRFADEEELERLYRDVYQSEHWKTVIAPQIPALLVREEMQVTRLVPTPRSPIQ